MKLLKEIIGITILVLFCKGILWLANNYFWVAVTASGIVMLILCIRFLKFKKTEKVRIHQVGFSLKYGHPGRYERDTEADLRNSGKVMWNFFAVILYMVSLIVILYGIYGILTDAKVPDWMNHGQTVKK